MRTIDELVSESPVFEGMTNEQLQLIAGCAQNAGFAAGERLFREGEPADTFYLVRKGRVALSTHAPARGPVLIETLDPGEIVATCLHPGLVATAIGQRGGLVGLGWRLMKPFMISPEEGAETPVFLATVPDPGPFHGAYVIRKGVAEPDLAARDGYLGKLLWDESARLTEL